MGKYKPIPQNYLFNKLLQYWGNLVENFPDQCTDNDFFDVMRNCFDHEKAVELIEAAYTPNEMTSTLRSTRCSKSCGTANGRARNAAPSLERRASS